METKILKIENLSFRFDKKQKYLFHNISTKFLSKQINFITGPNGSGKSTLFKILQGKVNQNEEISGYIYIEKQKHSLNNYKNLKNLQLHTTEVKQNFDLMLASNFTFKQNLQLANLPAKPKLSKLPEYIPIKNIINNLNINLDKPIHFLSGGQRQILAILMALQKTDTILLLDEPTAALDEENTKNVITFLNDLAQKTDLIIIVICHDKQIISTHHPSTCFNLKTLPHQ